MDEELWKRGCGNVETKTIQAAAPPGSLTPCILDDDPEQLSVLSEMFSEIGYQSLLTADPEDAVPLMRSGDCRVILATSITWSTCLRISRPPATRGPRSSRHHPHQGIHA